MLIRLWLINTCSLILSLTVSGQSDTSFTRIEKTKYQYTHIENIDTNLFAITNNGSLIIWDLVKLDTIQSGITDSRYHFSAITRQGNELLLGCEDGRIFGYDILTKSLRLVTRCKGPIDALAINSLGALWIANPDGIYDPVSHETWDQFSNHSGGREVIQKKGRRWVHVTTYYARPELTFLDSEDRWWLAASHGEFGGDLELFDTRAQKILNNHFDSLQMGMFFPQSVGQIPGKGIFISSGLQHFQNFGEILLIDKNDKVTRLFSTKKQFIGPAAYNTKDSCVYFASGEGIHKAGILADGMLKEPVLLFGTRLSSTQEPLAIGQAMPVKRLLFTSRGLIFLTVYNGIGLYDGKEIYYLQ